MTVPVIYDIASDTFRPVTQAEVNAMITRLNGRAAPISGMPTGGAGWPPPPGGVASAIGIVAHPAVNAWSAEATQAAR